MKKKENPIEEQKQEATEEIRRIIDTMCETKTDEAIRMGIVKLTKNIIEIAQLNLQQNQDSINGNEILWWVTDAAGM